jgi:hypothetical protein
MHSENQHLRLILRGAVASFLNALATYSPGRPGEAETAQQNTTPPEAETVAGTQQ